MGNDTYRWSQRASSGTWSVAVSTTIGSSSGPATPSIRRATSSAKRSTAWTSSRSSRLFGCSTRSSTGSYRFATAANIAAGSSSAIGWSRALRETSAISAPSGTPAYGGTVGVTSGIPKSTGSPNATYRRAGLAPLWSTAAAVSSHQASRSASVAPDAPSRMWTSSSGRNQRQE